MKRILAILIAIPLCLLLLEAASYAFSFHVSPPGVKITLRPGGTASGTITVYNSSDNEIGIKVYTQDWSLDPDGSKTFHSSGTTPLSCSKWIRLFPKKFQLKTGDRMPVQYTINMPEGAEGGYYSVVFFESMPLSEDMAEGDMMVQFAARLGTIIYVETEGKVVRRGSIDSLSIMPPQSDRPLEGAVAFKNTGSVFISAQGTLNIIDKDGNVYGRKEILPVNVLPGETREVKFEWLGELEEGDYDVVVTLDIGGDMPLVEEAKLEVAYGGILEDFTVDVSSGKPSFSVLVKNTGHLNIDTYGKITITSRDGEAVRSLSLKKSLIAPGKSKEINTTLQEGLPKGTYTAKAVISIAGKERTKEEIFVIP